MKGLPDYYADARGVAAAMLERGEFEWSRQIEDAIDGGSTATEILMRVRFTLRRLIESGAASTEEERILRLIDQLDAVLR